MFNNFCLSRKMKKQMNNRFMYSRPWDLSCWRGWVRYKYCMKWEWQNVVIARLKFTFRILNVVEPVPGKLSCVILCRVTERLVFFFFFFSMLYYKQAVTSFKTTINKQTKFKPFISGNGKIGLWKILTLIWGIARREAWVGFHKNPFPDLWKKS